MLVTVSERLNDLQYTSFFSFFLFFCKEMNLAYSLHLSLNVSTLNKIRWQSAFTLTVCNWTIEHIEKSTLKIILQELFIDHDTALEICALPKLSQRRQSHYLSFSKICLKNKQTSTMFPINPDLTLHLRYPEKFQFNFAHTENYKNSTVPFCQRLLNQDY